MSSGLCVTQNCLCDADTRDSSRTTIIHGHRFSLRINCAQFRICFTAWCVILYYLNLVVRGFSPFWNCKLWCFLRFQCGFPHFKLRFQDIPELIVPTVSWRMSPTTKITAQVLSVLHVQYCAHETPAQVATRFEDSNLSIVRLSLSPDKQQVTWKRWTSNPIFHQLFESDF